MITPQTQSIVKAGFDVSSLSVITAWWAGWAPSIATTLTVVWIIYCLTEVTIEKYNKYKSFSEVRPPKSKTRKKISRRG